MTNLDKLLLEYHVLKNRIITEYNDKIDVMNQDAEDVRRYGELFLSHFLNQEIESFLTKVYEQAYKEAFVTIPNPSYSQAEVDRLIKKVRQEAIEERDKYWKTLMENVCAVGRNFPARCYECGEKHASGMSWEEAYKANALFGKCFKCLSKELNVSASLKDKSK